jgi:hypothetical protein
VDVFRVRGGKIHDWMLHGCLQLPYTLTTTIDRHSIAGRRHKYLTDLTQGDGTGDWKADFVLPNGPTCRLHMMGQSGATVAVGQGPAMRRIGRAEFLDVRHTGGSSLFVAVHEPFEKEPTIESVEFRDLGKMAVAVHVHLRNGGVDTIISTADEPPYPVRHVPHSVQMFRGVVGHVRQSSSGGWAYLIRGDELRGSGLSALRAKPAAGTVLRTTRTEDSSSQDTFLVSGKVDPKGMPGRTLICDLGGLLVQSFTIDKIEPTGKNSLIVTSDDPGLTVQPDLVKLQHFPCWGIRGACRFMIDRPVLTRAAASGVQTTESPPSEKSQRPALRTWTDASGQHHIEASFAGMDAGQIKLRKADGTVISIPLEKLSEVDQQWVRQHSR